MKKENKMIEWWRRRKHWEKGGIIGFVLALIISLSSYTFILTVLLGKLEIKAVTILFFSLIFNLLVWTTIGGIVGFIISKIKKNKRKKNKFPLAFVIVPLAIIIFFVIFLLVVIRPIGGIFTVITEDRPILSFLCNLQVGCGDSSGSLTCKEEWDNSRLYQSLSAKERKKANVLLSWDAYKGCNESTPGFFTTGSGRLTHRYIKVKYCSCGFPV